MPKQSKQSTRWTSFVGDRGESIFELAIMDYSRLPAPLFRPTFLGDKWPAVDFLVELTGVRGMTPVFFVQVKSTARAIANNRLEVVLPPRRSYCLLAFPVRHT